MLGVPPNDGMNLLQDYMLSVSDDISSAMADTVKEELGEQLAKSLRAG